MIYKFKAKISGMSHLRHNKFLEDVKLSTKVSEKQREKNAHDRAYYDKEIGYYIPRQALKACLVKVGARVKVQGNRGAGNELKAILVFEQEKFPINCTETGLHKEVVRIPPRTGGRVVQYWVINKNWSVEFEGMILDDAFEADDLKKTIGKAGLYNGLLDGRPQFGRFVLDSFEVTDRLE